MERMIQDFGMEIVGARKNKNKENKEETLPKLNHPGNFLLICRDNIWPETNGEELVASGIPQGVAYWREQIRKAIPPHPENADEVSMVNYFNVISELRDQVNQVNDAARVESFFDYLQQNYLSTSDNHNQHLHVTAPAKDVVSPKLLKEAKTAYPTYERKAEKIFFGIPKKTGLLYGKNKKNRNKTVKPKPIPLMNTEKSPFLSLNFLRLPAMGLLIFQKGTLQGRKNFYPWVFEALSLGCGCRMRMHSQR